MPLSALVPIAERRATWARPDRQPIAQSLVEQPVKDRTRRGHYLDDGQPGTSGQGLAHGHRHLPLAVNAVDRDRDGPSSEDACAPNEGRERQSAWFESSDAVCPSRSQACVLAMGDPQTALRLTALLLPLESTHVLILRSRTARSCRCARCGPPLRKSGQLQGAQYADDMRESVPRVRGRAGGVGDDLAKLVYIVA
jgi:hypothetical protein